MKMKKYSVAIIFLIIISFFPASVKSQQWGISSDIAGLTEVYPEMLWVDSVMNSLTVDERIAQLLMIRTYSNKDRRYYDSISRLIIQYNIGGLTFFQGSPVRQAELINYWQYLAKTPLMVSIDAEWGLAMRLDSVIPFPKHMTMGAVQDEEVIYKAGYHIGAQCKRAGIQMNFAPVMDINSNPKNPVINFRSFGEDKVNVAEKGAAFIQGMQNAGVIATAKHFPGHGDTDTDSHYTLPVLNHSIATIDSADLYPFRSAIAAQTGAIMTAHLFIPAIDSTKNRATSLSDKAINQLMKNKMGFKGLAITDALDMDGVTNYHKPGEIELMALLAGNDILLLTRNIPLALQKIKEAVVKGLISQEEIDARCRKILAYKYKTGLAHKKPVTIENLTNELNSSANSWVTQQIFEKAITIVKNDHGLIPLTHLDTLKIAALSIGSIKTSPFQQRLGNYASVELFNLPSNPDKAAINEIISKLNDFNLIIVGVENTNNNLSKNYGISSSAKELIGLLKARKNKIILDVFGNPYSLSNFSKHQGIDVIICSYEDNSVSKDISAQIIFGAIGASGRLPVSASSAFSVGTGVDTKPIGRLKYTLPEELGISSEKLDTITKLIESGIKQGAYPGCQVLFAKNGKVFYNKAFGHHTYDRKRSIQTTDLYDLASLTKILATTPAIMQMYEMGSFNLDEPLSEYLPFLKNSNKQSRTIREIMVHQAQFQSWIPFYKKTIKDFALDPTIYSSTQTKLFDQQVAKNLFISNSYREIIFDSIAKSKLLPKREYKYSDLGFILLSEAVEEKTKMSFEKYCEQHFYHPMGLPTIGFKPIMRFSLEKIAPTERDTTFRKQLIHGYVHDPTAAMLGGISGHAGLFGNAAEVAAIMQMFLQNGYYGGQRYFSSNTMAEFTRQQFPLSQNRRGLGFDKPFPVFDPNGPVSKEASLDSFGHSGFTGTYTWADPKNQLIYVFLSNRIYPDADNRKLMKMNLRTKIHELMCQILNEIENSVLKRP
ncbi:MAG: putative lipoprotein YbbD precursor [Bacteroidetes bacterium ADurb.Bin041]|nr:MAG: putative lipoprotein YbbD precursor [Bacteroidetes bacterium ADurb.Bin041]